MDAALREALTQALGAGVSGAERLTGGDINDAFEVQLDDGRALFVKTHAHAPPGMFGVEARGLHWLAESRAVRVPEVLAVADSPGGPSFLVLELVRSVRPRSGFHDELGRALAALHRFGAPGFGFEQDGFIGRLAQSNRAHARWSDFYREERLLPQWRLAVDHGRSSARMRRGFETLFARLDELCGPPEPPARLHGDLWGGNLHVDEQGGPCLIDPAAYGGHREVDLAMMKLFGGFASRVFDAYHEAFPLAPGHAGRVALYQLYPLLVHLNLFGSGYAGSVESALSSYA